MSALAAAASVLVGAFTILVAWVAGMQNGKNSKFEDQALLVALIALLVALALAYAAGRLA